MNLDSKNLTNILIIGIGITSFIIFLFFPDYLFLLSDFKGYLISLFVGFCIFPFMRLTKYELYYKGNQSVIGCVESILDKNNIGKEKAEKLARPVYDLFLREAPNAANLTKRIHDLDLQARFLYSLHWLFFSFSIFLIIALILKYSFFIFNIPYSCKIIYFWEFKNMVTANDYNKMNFIICPIIVFAFVFLFWKIRTLFRKSTNNTLTRLHNLEKMAIVNNTIFFQNISIQIVRNNEIIKKMGISDDKMNAQIQP
jgi:hypothetical protein